MDAPKMDQSLELQMHGLLSERHRRAYLHDMRGGLQAIQNAFELLTRAAKSTGDNSAMIERASDLAKRALCGHERTIERCLDHLILRDEKSTQLSMRELLRDIVQFLQNDLASKEIHVNQQSGDDFLVHAQFNKLRMVVLGIVTDVLDALPRGSTLHLALSREKDCGMLEVGDFNLRPRELTLAVARGLLEPNGGQLLLSRREPTGSRVQLFYPIG
jgi:signal transduction histidine kinase